MPLQYNTTIAPHTQLPPIQEVHLGRFLKCISNKILQDNYVFSLVGTSVGKQMPRFKQYLHHRSVSQPPTHDTVETRPSNLLDPGRMTHSCV